MRVMAEGVKFQEPNLLSDDIISVGNLQVQGAGRPNWPDREESVVRNHFRKGAG